MNSKLLGGLVGPKTDIKISLDEKRAVYSNLDRIQGFVTITPASDLPFDDIDIEFVGTTRTYVERLTTAAAISGRSQAFHQFLRLSQPGTASFYPQDLILRANKPYRFPFLFVVPQQLLPRICSHRVAHDSVHDAHLRLPPTFGDTEPENKADRIDDMAPEMASIRYGVYAKISRVKHESTASRRVTVVAKARKLRIVPAVDEQPPLDVDHNEDYVLRKEKKLRKGLLKGKLGTLVVEAQQPQSLRLSPPNSDSGERATSMANVLLRFDPSDDNAQPPRLSTLSSKLKAVTFYSSAARRDFPSRSDSLTDLGNGAHSETIDLSSRCIANVEWQLIQPEARKLSSCSSSEATPPRRTSSNVSGPLIPPEPSQTYAGGPFYVARILVPIELPANKAFVPTFHSCLISRTYTLALHLSTNSTPTIGGNMDLRLPIQISSAPSPDANLPPPPSLATMDGVAVDDDGAEAAGADEFFEPRTIHTPAAGFIGRSRLSGGADDDRLPETANRRTPRDSVIGDAASLQAGLPEYSLFAPGARRGRAGVSVF